MWRCAAWRDDYVSIDVPPRELKAFFREIEIKMFLLVCQRVLQGKSGKKLAIQLLLMFSSFFMRYFKPLNNLEKDYGIFLLSGAAFQSFTNDLKPFKKFSFWNLLEFYCKTFVPWKTFPARSTMNTISKTDSDGWTTNNATIDLKTKRSLKNSSRKIV